MDYCQNKTASGWHCCRSKEHPGPCAFDPPEQQGPLKTASASQILLDAASTVEQRGVDYNKPSGERSMAQIVELFNQLTGHTLTTLDGWRFMILLKLVRAQKNPAKTDSWLDLSAYGALAGEESAK